MFTTDRLILRVPTLDDAAPLLAITRDPEVASMLGRPPDADEAALRERLARGLAARTARVPGFFVVELRDGGGVIGTAGLGPGAVDDELELGFTLAREVWGRGLATEAARACLALASTLVPRVTARTLPHNARAIRVLEKLGFRPAGGDGALLHFLLEWPR